jgi:hypothetical protein
MRVENWNTRAHAASKAIAEKSASPTSFHDFTASTARIISVIVLMRVKSAVDSRRRAFRAISWIREACLGSPLSQCLLSNSLEYGVKFSTAIWQSRKIAFPSLACNSLPSASKAGRNNVHFERFTGDLAGACAKQRTSRPSLTNAAKEGSVRAESKLANRVPSTKHMNS